MRQAERRAAPSSPGLLSLCCPGNRGRRGERLGTSGGFDFAIFSNRLIRWIFESVPARLDAPARWAAATVRLSYRSVAPWTRSASLKMSPDADLAMRQFAGARGGVRRTASGGKWTPHPARGPFSIWRRGRGRTATAAACDAGTLRDVGRAGRMGRKRQAGGAGEACGQKWEATTI